MWSSQTGSRIVAKSRPKIDEDLVAKILFEADRTCCVCRDRGKQVQIHHVDGNPANNEINNLIVLCLDCHSQAHSNIAFARNLTPKVLQKYRENWHNIILARRSLPENEAERKEYHLTVIGSLRHIACSFEGGFINFHPKRNLLTNPAPYPEGSSDYSEALVAFANDMEYSKILYEAYFPLYKDYIPSINNRFMQFFSAFGDVVPNKIKSSTINCINQVDLYRHSYLNFESIFSPIRPEDRGFGNIMSWTMKCYLQVYREVDALDPQ